ncbi:MAG: nucleoside triphosphate pyrophosphohydrolase family protein [Bacteroidia bacterium]|nr:nucleoside triphosphate pyrophosphohydrolase family protein [Bacteroidia bacterium]
MAELKKYIQQVENFQTTFKLKVNNAPTVEVDDVLIELRHRLMHEENEEYLEACKNKDLTEVADALGDKLYILLGTIITHGMQHVIEDVFNEIHSSNMSKLDENGKPIYREDGKIMKSNKYFKPDINAILGQHLKQEKIPV